MNIEKASKQILRLIYQDYSREGVTQDELSRRLAQSFSGDLELQVLNRVKGEYRFEDHREIGIILDVLVGAGLLRRDNATNPRYLPAMFLIQ